MSPVDYGRAGQAVTRMSQQSEIKTMATTNFGKENAMLREILI